MHDPFPISSPAWLAKAITPFSNYYGLYTLPAHIHEVLLAFLFYHVTNTIVSPWLSRRLFPKTYMSFNKRTRLNWDVHVVSLVQSSIINFLALWVMWADHERKSMDTYEEGWKERIWGYDGADGMIQAFACGYFLWDLLVSVQHVDVFGIGLLFHAISALVVFSFGFRPFVNYYAPTFIIYELSSPFLNIHWFCDKLDLTGSTLQLYNGILLILTFFGCRLCWGTWQSVRVFSDIYKALHHQPSVFAPEHPLESMRYITTPEKEFVPLWLALSYLGANLILNGLNFFWFTKMIETIRKRFDPPLGTRKEETPAERKHRRSLSAPVLVEGVDVEDADAETSQVSIQRGIDEQGRTSVEIQGTEVRRRVM